MRITKSNQEKNKRKALKMNLKKKIQGITLIALVVTVIVLLILAGVAINLTIGDNGMFKRAQNAADTYQEASEREAIELAVAGMQIGSTQGNDMTKTELENSLEDQFGDDASVEDNEDGSFLVTIGENQYYLGENGEIIDSSNMVKISTADELKAFRDDVNSGNTYEGKYVYLANDITLDINEEWEPIGYYSQDTESIRKVLENEKNKPFSGIFDGHGHTINNMYINTSNVGQGFFGLVINGEIKNAVLSLQPVAHRLQWMYNGNDVIIDDSFSSNEAGFVSAAEVLSQFSYLIKVIITPGVVELGKYQFETNYRLGAVAAKSCDYLIAIGKNARALKNGALSAGLSPRCIAEAGSRAEAMEHYKKIAGSKAVLFENDLPDNYE